MSSAAADEIVHQSTRLKILSALSALRRGERLEFVDMRVLVQTTDGNLGTHLGTLEKAGYVTIEKDFVGKKPRTRASMTRSGRRAFEQHVAYLRDLLDTDSRKAT
jgi:DNA-binding transcriptional ArsR family regulator